MKLVTLITKNLKTLLSDFGKREGLVYFVVLLWILLGIEGTYKLTSYTDMSIYFGALTSYAATYIWAETKRPSTKTSIYKPGPSSRREIMIYFVVFLWAIIGAFAIWFESNLADLSLYFVSLTGFVMSWIAGEVYKPQDIVNQMKKKEDEL